MDESAFQSYPHSSWYYIHKNWLTWMRGCFKTEMNIKKETRQQLFVSNLVFDSDHEAIQKKIAPSFGMTKNWDSTKEFNKEDSTSDVNENKNEGLEVYSLDNMEGNTFSSNSSEDLKNNARKVIKKTTEQYHT